MHFTEFCKCHVFEVPFSTYCNGHQLESLNKKQRLHIKVTNHFKAAFLLKDTTKTLPSTCDESKNVCSDKLGISLEDAKNIQRKIANILDLNPASLFLDTISEGSVILTFLLPTCVSLAGLDHNPKVALLSSCGIIILCGPPGKPERQELLPNGIVIKWPSPEYGCDSLRRCILYYQKKCKNATNQWKKIDHDSLETRTVCIPNLSIGDTYIFKVCGVSNVGTVQYSNVSDLIVLYNSVISPKDIYSGIIMRCCEVTALALSLANPRNNATSSSAKKITLKKCITEITLAHSLHDQAMILRTRIHKMLKSEPEKFQEFLDILSNESLTDNVVEAMQTVFYYGICSQYAECIKFLYASLNSKQTSFDQWPPSATRKFFRLAMIQAGVVTRGHIIDGDFIRMTITGKVDDIMHEKYPVKLENILLKH